MNRGFSRRLHRQVQVYLLAILNRDEREKVFLTKMFWLPESFFVTVKPWNQYAHWKNHVIGVRSGWLGIEGIPLNMRNLHVYKVSCNTLGGLINRARIIESGVPYVTLQVRGLPIRFIPATMKILCWGKEVQISLFQSRCTFETQGFTEL